MGLELKLNIYQILHVRQKKKHEEKGTLCIFDYYLFAFLMTSSAFAPLMNDFRL